MKLKNSYFYTLREDAKDEESVSSNLLVRSGMMKKVGSGIYMYLPLGQKALENIKKIVKEEMDNANALEVLMPSLIPKEYFEASGRVDTMGKSMFSLKDRSLKEYVLGPTHEELFTIAAASVIKSYKDMPFNIYQIADKFRDEKRPRFGLIRVREFFMKDAYSFDKDEEGLDKAYNIMKKAYNNIFDRLNIDYKIVKADTGVMGGSLSEEYQALTDIGEDVVVLCDNCDYASNLEVSTFSYLNEEEEKKKIELVETKNMETITDVCNYLNIKKEKTIKAMLMDVDGELVVFFIRGDRELNTNKACKLLKVNEINFANDELIASSNAVAGFTGPINLNAKTVIDTEILKMSNFCCGANKKDYHYINCNIDDIKYDIAGDISSVQEGDVCPNCKGKLYFKKGIEIGNLFKLGTKYSEKLELKYLDENNTLKPVVMGSYGLGIGRVLASIIEQNHDENGIIFPLNVAPYKIAIILLDEANTDIANKLYKEFNDLGIDTILDDRDERPGVKFKDMDLIGVTIKVTIGKRIDEGIVEVKLRTEKEYKEIDVDEVVTYLEKYVKDNLK